LIANNVTEIGSMEVPWFPTRVEDFDFIGKKYLKVEDGTIEYVDHPTFSDPVYRKRRNYIADLAFGYKMNDPAGLPIVDYSKDEIGVWQHCYPMIRRLQMKNACDETNEIIQDMEANVEGWSAKTIPQLEHISKYLESKTGWRLKPVGGLLTQREFLNGLAFKIFHST